MLFGNDIVLIDETREGVNNNLEQWKDTLDTKGSMLSKSKTKYLKCRFSEGKCDIEDEVIIEGMAITRVENLDF